MILNESSQSSSVQLGDTIDIPIENMGMGVFNALGDVIGGLVALNRFAAAKAQQGVSLLKEKFAKSETLEEEVDTTLPIDPVLRRSAHTMAEEPTKSATARNPSEPARVVEQVEEEE